MSLLAAISTAWNVASQVEAATAAARTALTAGHGPLVALHAFAAASENRLDDDAVGELEAAVARTIDALVVTTHVAATVAGWLEAHRAEVVAVVDTAIGVVIDVGYTAGAWRTRLDAWRT